MTGGRWVKWRLIYVKNFLKPNVPGRMCKAEVARKHANHACVHILNVQKHTAEWFGSRSCVLVPVPDIGWGL